MYKVEAKSQIRYGVMVQNSSIFLTYYRTKFISKNANKVAAVKQLCVSS